MDCAGITDHQQQLARLAATKPLTLETMSLALVQEYHCAINDYSYKSEIKMKTIGLYHITGVTVLY